MTLVALTVDAVTDMLAPVRSVFPFAIEPVETMEPVTVIAPKFVISEFALTVDAVTDMLAPATVELPFVIEFAETVEAVVPELLTVSVP